MTKLRKSKLDVVKPSYVLKGNEYFVIHHSRKDREDRDLYYKAMDAMSADVKAGRFKKRKKFKTFAEAREYAKKANQKYGTRFGVSVTEELNLDRLFSKIPF